MGHHTLAIKWRPALIQEIWVLNCAILLATDEARGIAANIANLGGLLLGCEPDVSLDQPQQRIGGQLLES
jgi:hypothetical protein